MAGFRNDSYMEARLGRWGMYKRWHERTHSPAGRPLANFGIGSWWGDLILDPKVQGPGRVPTPPDAPCPVDIEEARDTDRCVAVLPEKWRSVILQTYIKPGTVEQRLAYLGCSRWSYYTWLYQAYDQLLGYFNDVAAGIALPAIADVINEVA